MVGLGSIIVQLKTTSVGRRGCHLPSHLCTAKARQRQAFKRKVIPIPQTPQSQRPFGRKEAQIRAQSSNPSSFLANFPKSLQLPMI